MRTVSITPSESTPTKMDVRFLNAGKVVAHYEFGNYTGNGDMLTFEIGAWFVSGTLPKDQRGLIRLMRNAKG